MSTFEEALAGMKRGEWWQRNGWKGWLSLEGKEGLGSRWLSPGLPNSSDPNGWAIKEVAVDREASKAIHAGHLFAEDWERVEP